MCGESIRAKVLRDRFFFSVLSVQGRDRLRRPPEDVVSSKFTPTSGDTLES